VCEASSRAYVGFGNLALRDSSLSLRLLNVNAVLGRPEEGKGEARMPGQDWGDHGTGIRMCVLQREARTSGGVCG
jgi:hypothetical protein